MDDPSVLAMVVSYHDIARLIVIKHVQLIGDQTVCIKRRH